MPATHYIDNEAKLIITRWEGEATDTNFEEALKIYLNHIRSDPNCFGYNEIVDIRKASPMNITIKGLLTIGRIATDTEINENNMRMALVVKSGLALSFSNLYIFYRNMGRGDRKKISVFVNEDEAYEWVTSIT